MSTPPRRLERLVSTWLGDHASTPFVIGDLREEFAERGARWPSWVAAIWYLGQGLAVAARTRWGRRRDRGARAGTPPRRLLSPASRGDGVRMDVRLALRQLRRRPGFASAIVLTVALAVASTTIAFAVVDGVLLERLPYEESDRLVAVWETNPRGEMRNVVSPANYLTWRDEVDAFDVVASVIESSTTLAGEPPERVGVIDASASYFEVVGAEALIGRLFTEADDQPDAPDVVVMSEAFWRSRFGADPGVVGSSIELGGRSRTVVGVLADRFDFDLEWAFGGVGSHDLWEPAQWGPDARDAGGRYLQVVARLAPDASLEIARAETAALAQRLAETYPGRQRGWGISVLPLQGDLVGEASSTILVVFGAVCFVLLIGCANVANLLMTRATERQEEMAVRAAIGADRRRIVQQLLVEGAVLSALGGLVGLLLAFRGIDALLTMAPDIPRIEAIGLDATVLAFALVATAGTALIFGLAPALALPGADGRGERLRRGAEGRAATRVRGALTIAQVALSLMVLVGAGLLTRSLINRLDSGIGFDLEGLLVADVQLPPSAYPTAGERALFFERLVERAEGVSGVVGATAITWPPLGGGGTRTTVWALDRPVPEPGERPGADVRPVHRDYHRVVGLPLLAGRAFAPGDDAESPLVVLVNETGANQLWPGESALGKRIAMPWEDTLTAEVVGVVADARDDGPDTDPYPMLYWEHRQFSPFNLMSVVIRADDVDAAASGVRRSLSELDPSLPLYNVSPMAALFDDAIRQDRFVTVSLAGFALMALVLAAIGIYGVMAHATERRAPELGIRVALGASRRSILRLVVGRGMIQVGVAVVLGALGALALSRVLEGLVFDVSTADPLTFGGTAVLLTLVGLVACWLPARRAARVDPVETMRGD